MTETEKLVAAFRKLAEENAALKRKVEQQERDFYDTFRDVVTGFVERFEALEEAHRKAVDGFNEVLAGHEVALVGLGADPEPVRMVEEPTAPPDPQPISPETVDTKPPSADFNKRIQLARAQVVRFKGPTPVKQDNAEESYDADAPTRSSRSLTA